MTAKLDRILINISAETLPSTLSSPFSCSCKSFTHVVYLLCKFFPAPIYPSLNFPFSIKDRFVAVSSILLALRVPLTGGRTATLIISL